MMPAAIELAGVGKRYKKLTDLTVGGRGVGMFRRSRTEEFWALRGVDLTIDPGECVGVIGRNGSGKSTLLSMLAAVSAPSEGSVVIRGRVSPLLSVGVGFHPEMTGRENISMNGIVLGMTYAEIEQRFDEIVEFAGIGAFLDSPVKFYSSGMFVRLGFAVAVAATPDILLVDEVLAVGDLAFQVKCFDRMRELQEQGTTIILVTHNLQAMEVLATRGIVIDEGRLRFDGGVHAAIGHYHRRLTDEAPVTAAAVGSATKVNSLELLRPDGEPASSVTSGSDVVLRLDLGRDAADADPVLEVAVADDRMDVYSHRASWRQLGLAGRDRATVEARFRVP